MPRAMTPQLRFLPITVVYHMELQIIVFCIIVFTKLVPLLQR